jgi:hypothetical protein
MLENNSLNNFQNPSEVAVSVLNWRSAGIGSSSPRSADGRHEASCLRGETREREREE